jgi:hypothetical protein
VQIEGSGHYLLGALAIALAFIKFKGAQATTQRSIISKESHFSVDICLLRSMSITARSLHWFTALTKKATIAVLENKNTSRRRLGAHEFFYDSPGRSSCIVEASGASSGKPSDILFAMFLYLLLSLLPHRRSNEDLLMCIIATEALKCGEMCVRRLGHPLISDSVQVKNSSYFWFSSLAEWGKAC